MPTTLTDVADEGLPARVAALEATVAALTAEIAALRETVAMRDALIRTYQALLFGTKSEKGLPAALPPGNSPLPLSEKVGDGVHRILTLYLLSAFTSKAKLVR